MCTGFVVRVWRFAHADLAIMTLSLLDYRVAEMVRFVRQMTQPGDFGREPVRLNENP